MTSVASTNGCGHNSVKFKRGGEQKERVGKHEGSGEVYLSYKWEKCLYSIH